MHAYTHTPHTHTHSHAHTRTGFKLSILTPGPRVPHAGESSGATGGREENPYLPPLCK